MLFKRVCHIRGVNELDQAKHAWEKSQQLLSNAMLNLTPFVGEQRHPLRYSEEWQALYYSQPNTSQAAKSLAKKLAAFQARDEAAACQIAPFAAAAIEAAELVCKLRNAPKQPRKRSAVSRYGSGYRGSWASQPVAREAIKIGDYLVLSYGNGHQLVYVQGITSPKGLRIFRLANRGYTYACWVPSWISRFDRRIQGLGAGPTIGEPALPPFTK